MVLSMASWKQLFFDVTWSTLLMSAINYYAINIYYTYDMWHHTQVYLKQNDWTNPQGMQNHSHYLYLVTLAFLSKNAFLLVKTRFAEYLYVNQILLMVVEISCVYFQKFLNNKSKITSSTTFLLIFLKINIRNEAEGQKWRF